MFFSHKAAAVDGVGFGHKVLAILGLRWFDVEIIVQPIQGGGGGYVWDTAKPYEIIVRVKYKDKVWEERRYISAIMAKSLEKVVASFRDFRRSVIEIAATINTILRKQITVRIFRK